MLDTLIAGLYILVSPLGLVMLLLVLGAGFLILRWRRAGVGTVTGALLLLFLFANEPFGRLLLTPLESRYPALESVQGLEEVRWVVVLGSHASDASDLPATNRLSGVAALRLMEGIRLHNRLPESTLILSGGVAFSGSPSATVMSRAALELGADPERVTTHPGPRNTYEEAVKLRATLGEEAFILVTSASHMRRAMALAEAQGLNAIPAPTVWRTRSGKGDPRRFLPSSTGLAMSERAMHEYVGLLWARLRGEL
ncbi:YdcF family protein [Natronospira bacteriovora]|uniref:ElyC/SanA/YdcF family protein n=1 Tax=Natronospira bacteriovora TaxID=3069753 RepID=A0ABU0W7Z8_9GAMM|nr:ElyC/SanA/YdcF family protein [Natronospira sp. AB-CW4]MDQ2070116.1 ElyC/SanA/YdcF family protein [Natronospira sp. AB-CW4]